MYDYSIDTSTTILNRFNSANRDLAKHIQNMCTEDPDYLIHLLSANPSKLVKLAKIQRKLTDIFNKLSDLIPE